jgi:predicted nucleic acid-binding protein
VTTYADSSFIVRLLTSEAGSDEVVAEFRRLGRPRLAYSTFLALEVANALNLRIFTTKTSKPSRERSPSMVETMSAFSRIEHMLARKLLISVAFDWEETLRVAKELSNRHTRTVGSRTLDLMHLASATVLKADLFLTCDKRQAQVAKAERLETIRVGVGD